MHEAGDVNFRTKLARRSIGEKRKDRVHITGTKKECFGTLLIVSSYDRAAYAEPGITYIAYKYLSFSLLTVLTDYRIYNILTKKRHRLNIMILYNGDLM